VDRNTNRNFEKILIVKRIEPQPKRKVRIKIEW
jgi:hypothetical protein